MDKAAAEKLEQPAQATAKKPDKAPEKAEPEKRTPQQWALKFGHVKPRDPRLPQSTEHVDPSYAVARELYGWQRHAYDYQRDGQAFLLTERAYRAALKAAPQHPVVELVAEALTPDAAARLKGFAPKRSLKTAQAEKKGDS